MPDPTPADSRRVLELLEHCLELPTHEREALLRATANEDRQLATEVQALLAHDAAAGAFLEPLGPSPLAAAPPPEQLGPYRLGALLGEGGMGRVYRGERVTGEPRYPVAVKILRRTWDAAAGERLRAEQQALGGLEHPFICRMLDAGSTADGSPWIAMELVEGEPLTRHCDGARLSVRQRLELFISVLEAVEHAHAHLVVHGDIKPGNVLVTRRGDPKLVDFGIAARLAESGPPTSPTPAALTAAYASPEQLRGEPLRPAADVFSLGVLLYELLAGRLPFAARGLSREQLLAARMVPPTAPSAAGEDDTRRAAVAAARSTTPRRLFRALAGDLDAVVLAALAGDPTNRYGNVAALAADLRRHLAGQPVAARPASLAHRWRKAVTRRPAAAAAVALLLAALVALSALSVVALRSRDRAEAERKRAASATRLLLESLADLGPTTRRGGESSAALMLDRATARVRAQVAEPRMRADLLLQLGELQGAFGRYASALEALDEALDLRRGHAEPQMLGATLRAHSRACTDAGEHDRAEASARAALELLDGYGSAPSSERVEALRTLAWAVLRNSRNDELRLAQADDHARRALALGRELALESSTLAELERLHASTLLQRGRYAEALPLARSAVAGLATAQAPAEVQAEALNELAIIEERLGHLPLATDHYREVVSRLRGALGDHPELAGAINNLGTVLATQARFDEAAIELEQALALYERLLGADDLMTLNTAANLAHALLWGGRAAEAEPLSRRVAAGLAGSLETGHPFHPLARALVAESLAMQDRNGEANAELAAAERESSTLAGSGWMEPAFASIRGAIWGRQAPSPQAAELLDSSWQQLHELRGPWFQPTLDAARRRDQYRARWTAAPD